MCDFCDHLSCQRRFSRSTQLTLSLCLSIAISNKKIILVGSSNSGEVLAAFQHIVKIMFLTRHAVDVVGNFDVNIIKLRQHNK